MVLILWIITTRRVPTPANRSLELYIFKVINMYRKSREPTPSYLGFDSWGISLGNMAYPAATGEVFIVSWWIYIAPLKTIAHRARDWILCDSRRINPACMQNKNNLILNTRFVNINYNNTVGANMKSFIGSLVRASVCYNSWEWEHIMIILNSSS